MKNLLISFSGGRTSAFMSKLIQESPTFYGWNKLFVFANTGKEREETLEFVDRCDREFNLNLVWVEALVHPKKGDGTEYILTSFKGCHRNGEPFEDVIKKYGLPSKYFRHCTRELKEQPIHKYTRGIFGENYLTAIGIRADERHRVTNNPKMIYPLVDLGIDSKVVRDFWDRQSFDLGLKDYQGNCDLCFLKSLRKRMTLMKENPKSAKWWIEMEDKYGNDKQSKFSAHTSQYVREILKKSKGKFRKALDVHDVSKSQGELFDGELDKEFDCFCKSN